ncbi:MAG: hypothetical protein HYU99_04415 [Deltaproteobacteria bacterium]|nr:hypothetical protein [Deltaproteobacteria bacterium]
MNFQRDIQSAGSDGAQVEELTVQLEATLTKSSFGFEYAILNLKQPLPFAHRQSLLDQIDEHKKVYFRARELLGRLNPEKLCKVEQGLMDQKNALLDSSPAITPVTLH